MEIQQLATEVSSSWRNVQFGIWRCRMETVADSIGEACLLYNHKVKKIIEKRRKKAERKIITRDKMKENQVPAAPPYLLFWLNLETTVVCVSLQGETR